MNSPVIQAYLAESMMNLNEDARLDDGPIPLRPRTAQNQVALVQPLLPATSETSPGRPVSAAETVAPIATPQASEASTESRPGANKPSPATQATQQQSILPQVAPAASGTAKQQPARSDDIFKQYWTNQQ